MSHPYEAALEEMVSELRPELEELGHLTYDSKRTFDKGLYGCLWLKPAKRLANALETTRELLVVVTTFADLQQRTIKFSKAVIEDSKGRLDQNIVVVAHQDPNGDATLREWGRELTLMVLPVYMGGERRRGLGLERLFSRELFSHDPFDLAGPIRVDRQFFGRSDVDDIARRLRHGQIKAYFGIRKIGKTSMLDRIVDRCTSNFDAACVMLDAQTDGLWKLSGAQLLDAITAAVIEALGDPTNRYRSVIPVTGARPLTEVSWTMQYTLQNAKRPVVLVIDEVDFITPSNSEGDHWETEFNVFFRSLRTIYQEMCRLDSNFSVVISGVSSRWFFTESVGGIENAALAFVPEEYLGPFNRAQSLNMIRSLGKTSGLHFSPEAADVIAETCADIPYWMRKAGSLFHRTLDPEDRPVNVNVEQARELMNDFAEADGWALAEISLRHLFRVFPELLPVAASIAGGDGMRTKANRRHLSALRNYGILDRDNNLRGPLMRAGVEALVEESELGRDGSHAGKRTATEEWGERVGYLARERGLLEKRLRGFIVQVLRIRSEGKSDGPSAKEAVLNAIPQERRDPLASLRLDDLIEHLFWLDLLQIVKRNWEAFSRYFGDKNKFEQHCDIVNDRPDAHARDFDEADLAMYRRSVRHLNGMMDKLE